MKRQPRITVLGSFNTDLSVITPRMPFPGETILGGPFSTGPGGKGANQAVACARLGAEVTAVVKLGKDYYGDLAKKNLISEAINCEYVIYTEETHTGVAFILVDKTGENMIVVAGGANNLFSTKDVDQSRAAIIQADILLLQLEIPIETVRYAAMIAHAEGIKVLLNPAPGTTLDTELLGFVDYLTPNETEAELITGVKVNSLESAKKAALSLIEKGVKNAIITLGANGSLVVTPNLYLHVPGRKVAAIDTTGAGDAFNGALSVALAEEKGMEEALIFANCAAALQVTKRGTAKAMPYRTEVDMII